MRTFKPFEVVSCSFLKAAFDHFPFSFEVSINALKVLRFIQDNNFAAVSRLKINSSLSRELEVLTRHYLRYLLEREVKSVAWLDTLREQIQKLDAKPEQVTSPPA